MHNPSLHLPFPTPDPLPDPRPFSLLFLSFSYFLFFFELSRCIKSEFAGVRLTPCSLNMIRLEAKIKTVKTLKTPK